MSSTSPVLEELQEFLDRWFYGGAMKGDWSNVIIARDENNIYVNAKIFDHACTENYLPPASAEEVQSISTEELIEEYGEIHFLDVSVYDVLTDDEILYLKRRLACERSFRRELDRILSKHGYKRRHTIQSYMRYTRVI